MPELPEVEVTRRLLVPLLVGRVISEVRTTAPSYVFLTDPARLRRRLRGRTVTRLTRLGKYIVGELDDGRRLLLHLGMTGQLFGRGVASPRLLSATARASLTPQAQRAPFRPDVHTHVRIRFADGGPEVFFRDVRKLGKVQLLEPGEASRRLDRLGRDALRLRAADLLEATRGRRVALKTLLLDQAAIAGVGNIYADEALFLAGLSPLRRAERLTRAEAAILVAAIRKVLRRGIATGGSSISDYVQPDGEDGGYQDERRVYGRTGEPCPRCARPIRRRVLGQRSAHYCPGCQR